ncbi:MAG: tyrosine-type recombinase/integrase [Armatimonadota bacterium]
MPIEILGIHISPRAVAQIIQRAVLHAGVTKRRVAPHSLRSGHVTVSSRAGISERVIMRQTGHRSELMVRRYIREAELFVENSACSLGL